MNDILWHKKKKRKGLYDMQGGRREEEEEERGMGERALSDTRLSFMPLLPFLPSIRWE